MTSNTKPLKKYFLPFNFAVTKTCNAIHLAGDKARMGSI